MNRRDFLRLSVASLTFGVTTPQRLTAWYGFDLDPHTVRLTGAPITVCAFLHHWQTLLWPEWTYDALPVMREWEAAILRSGEMMLSIRDPQCEKAFVKSCDRFHVLHRTKGRNYV